MPEFFDVVFGQRAYRSLLPDPVPDELVTARAGGGHPRAERREPPAVGVRRRPRRRHPCGDRTGDAGDLGGGGREHSRALPPPFFEAVDRWATGGLAAAPVHVVVCGDTTRCPEAQLPSSIFPAVQNLLLAALAVGLGSLMSTLSVVNRAAVQPAPRAPGPRRADGARPAGMAGAAARPGRPRAGGRPPPLRTLGLNGRRPPVRSPLRPSAGGSPWGGSRSAARPGRGP